MGPEREMVGVHAPHKPGRGRPRTTDKSKRRSNFALRLQPSLLEGARNMAAAQGVSMNRLITIALVEKLSTLRADDAVPAAPPMEGDEIPKA